jgi:hypothetical protein
MRPNLRGLGFFIARRLAGGSAGRSAALLIGWWRFCGWTGGK